MVSKSNKLVIISVIVLGVLLVTSNVFLYAKAKPQTPEASAEVEKVPVEVTTVKRSDLAATMMATGTVEAYLNAVISAEIGGEIVNVYVDEGTAVKENDSLLKIDDYTLKLQRERADANFIGAKSGYEYVDRVAKLQVETRVKQAEAAVASALAQYEYTKNLAQSSMEAKLKQAQANRDMAASRLLQMKTGARPEEREQLQSAKEAAQVNYDNAVKNYERTQKLYDHKAVSSQQFEESLARKEGAAAQLKAASEAQNMGLKGARDEDIVAAKANLDQAESFFKLAEKEYAAKGWEKDVALANSAWEQAEANVVLMRKELESRAFEADVRQAEARFKDAQANLKILDRQVAQTVIKAPFSGIVYGRKGELGEMVAPGQPLIRVMQIERVKVASTIGEANVAAISKGQKVNVTVDAYPGKTFTGKIVEVSPAVEQITRTISLKVELDNSQRLLKPGMFARLNIETEKRAQALVIPKDALVEKDNRQYVYVIQNGKALTKEVQLGLEAKDNWEVKQGLTENETIVIVGQSNLADGKEVTIIKR